MNTKDYYKTVSGNSLYKWADELNINSYQFDILKRIIRCRHKGTFKQDLSKTKDLIEIYKSESKTKTVNLKPKVKSFLKDYNLTDIETSIIKSVVANALDYAYILVDRYISEHN